MIKEILTYITENPKLVEAKKFGHLKESISLIAREKRCEKAWLPHRNQCKNFILKSLIFAQHFDSVLILGSGPLHEIPILELSKKFKNITCVDIVHLSSTKKSVEHLPNIEFIEHDITELESALVRGQLDLHVPTTFLDRNWGLVMSINLMSQLPLHLEHYIKMHFKNKFSEKLIENYLKAVTSNHLLYLKSFNRPVILITDDEIQYYSRQDEVVESQFHLKHLDFPKNSEEWLWNLAPIPEYDKELGVKLKVKAFLLNS